MPSATSRAGWSVWPPDHDPRQVGTLREALADIDGAIAAADASGLARSLGSQLLAQAARASFSVGDWDAAGRRVTDGLARRPAAPIEAELRAVGLRLAVARGRPAEAATLDARLAVLAPAVGDAEGAAAVRVARAEAAIAGGSPQSAWALLETQLATRAAGTESGPSAAWLAALAIGAEVEVALDARATGDAVAATEALRRVAVVLEVVRREVAEAGGRWGPLADAVLAHVEAEAARLDDDAHGRVAAWAAAVRGWDAIDRPFHAAGARYRLAEARLANGESRTEIGDALGPAASIAHRLGATPSLDRIRRLARLARVELRPRVTRTTPGTRPWRVDAGAAAASDPLATLGLTPREREVLRRVAAGSSNARIADDLGISVSPRRSTCRTSWRSSASRTGSRRRRWRTGWASCRRSREEPPASPPGSGAPGADAGQPRRPAPLLPGTGRRGGDVRWSAQRSAERAARRGSAGSPRPAWRAGGRARSSNAASATSAIE